MGKKILIYTLKFFLILTAILFLSCQKESEADNDGYSSARKEIENSKLFKTIANTTWKHEKTETYTYADDLQRTHYSNAVITFTGECSADAEYVCYFAHFNGHSQIVEWTINDGNLRYYLMTKEFTDIYSASECGEWIAKIGRGGKVVRLTESKLTLQSDYDDSYTIYNFSRYYGSNGSGSSSGGDHDNDEGCYITCTWCKGSGKCHGCGGDGLWLGNAEKCDYCEGSGVCEHCNGTGILEY